VKLVVLGGSGASTPELFESLEAWPGGADRRPELTVVLAGRSASKLELVAAACRARVTGAGRAVRVEASTDRRRALEGADVVLNQVRVGGLPARAFDESFPWAYDLPGEETMGPGGFANALRTIPVVIEELADVTAIAPAALVVNLTNPAGMALAAALRTTSLNMVEVCDSPLTLLDAVAERLGRAVSQVGRRYVGMNHIGWYVPESPGEIDALADLAPGMDPAAVRLHEALPAPYVRYYVHPDRILAAQRGKETRAHQLQRLEASQLAAYAESPAGGAPRRGAAWYARAVVPFLDAWIHGSPDPMVLGVPNRGTVPGLPDDVVVEVPVAVSGGGVLQPLEIAPLPPLPAALLAAHAAFERLTVTALLEARGGEEADRVSPDEPADDSLLRALAANPMVCTFDQAAGLLEAIHAGSPGSRTSG